MSRIAFLVACAVSLGSAAQAEAQSATSLDVSLNVGAVVPEATIHTLPLNFGAGASADATGETALLVTATVGLPFSITLDGGVHSPFNGHRTMVFEALGLYIPYVLTQDPEHFVYWGDGAAFGDPVIGTGTGGEQVFTVYAFAYSSGYESPGTYTDVVTATINF